MTAPPPPTAVYRLHTSPVSSLCYLDKLHLMSGSQSGQMLLVHRPTRRTVHALEFPSAILALQKSPSAYLVQTRSSGIFMYDSAINEECMRLDPKSASFCRCSLLSHPLLLASAGSDENELLVWDLKSSPKPIFSFAEKSHGMVMDTKFINEHHVAAVYEDGQLLVFSISSPQSPLISLTVQQNKNVATSFDLFAANNSLTSFSGLAGGSTDELTSFSFDLNSLDTSTLQLPASETPGRGKGVVRAYFFS